MQLALRNASQQARPKHLPLPSHPSTDLLYRDVLLAIHRDKQLVKVGGNAGLQAVSLGQISLRCAACLAAAGQQAAAVRACCAANLQGGRHRGSRFTQDLAAPEARQAGWPAPAYAPPPQPPLPPPPLSSTPPRTSAPVRSAAVALARAPRARQRLQLALRRGGLRATVPACRLVTSADDLSDATRDRSDQAPPPAVQLYIIGAAQRRQRGRVRQRQACFGRPSHVSKYQMRSRNG